MIKVYCDICKKEITNIINIDPKAKHICPECLKKEEQYKEAKQRIEEFAKECIEIYGLDPRKIGMRHRSFGIVTELDDEETRIGVELGDLGVKTRDGGNDIDPSAFDYPNFKGTIEDSFDPTYRFYYYAPLHKKKLIEFLQKNASKDPDIAHLLKTLNSR